VRDAVQDLAPVLHELRMVLGVSGHRRGDGKGELALALLVLGDGSARIARTVEFYACVLRH